MSAPAIRTCLWFDGDAEAAAKTYVALLPGSRIEHVYPQRGDPHGLTKRRTLVRTSIHKRTEGSAAEELHDQIGATFNASGRRRERVDTGVVHGDDIGMGQLRDRNRFATKSLDEVAIVGKVRVEHLYGDVAIERFVVGLPNLRHTAASDWADEDVAARDAFCDASDRLSW